jgi:hypothetical protein
MSGGITQLVAIGAQDAHLVGDPQVSFFRSVYKRHTNFAHVVERQVIQGNPSPGGISTIRLERRGDLASYIYLTSLTAAGLAQNFPAGVITKVELLIGGQVIDDQDHTFITSVADPYTVSSVTKAGTTATTFYPLHFWFCENYQSALPLVALQYHDVEIRITWGAPSTNKFECYCDYIYLDTDERTSVAETAQDMLIYQTQKSIPPSAGKIHELNFNHPIKFLASNKRILGAADDKLRLQLNGVDVGDTKKYTPHFNVTPRYYHCPFLTDAEDEDSFLLPFCLETNKLQPTGSLNFSRLDSARLVSDKNFTSTSNVYAVNYNILRIQNGMGGILYAN